MTIPARVQSIIETVADEFRVSPADIIGPSKRQKFYRARRRAMKMVRSIPWGSAGRPPSYPLIGQWFGGRDHATVIHAVRDEEGCVE